MEIEGKGFRRNWGCKVLGRACHGESKAQSASRSIVWETRCHYPAKHHTSRFLRHSWGRTGDRQATSVGHLGAFAETAVKLQTLPLRLPRHGQHPGCWRDPCWLWFIRRAWRMTSLPFLTRRKIAPSATQFCRPLLVLLGRHLGQAMSLRVTIWPHCCVRA